MLVKYSYKKILLGVSISEINSITGITNPMPKVSKKLADKSSMINFNDRFLKNEGKILKTSKNSFIIYN